MDTAVIDVLINAGVAGVIVFLFVIGVIPSPGQVRDLKEEVRRLREALSLERARADTAVQATNTTNQILGALHEIASYDHPSRNTHVSRMVEKDLRGEYEVSD